METQAYEARYAFVFGGEGVERRLFVHRVVDDVPGPLVAVYGLMHGFTTRGCDETIPTFLRENIALRAAKLFITAV